MSQPPQNDDDPTPLWLVGLIIFGIAGIGGPAVFVLFNWFF